MDIERQGQHVAQQAGAAADQQAGGGGAKAEENPAALAKQGFPGLAQAAFEQYRGQFGDNAAAVHRGRGIADVAGFQRLADTHQAAVDPVGLHAGARGEHAPALGGIDPAGKAEGDIFVREDLQALQSDEQLLELPHQRVAQWLSACAEYEWGL